MPNISDFFQSSFFKTADLLGKPIRLIMNELEIIEFDEGKKPALSFQKTDKQMVLNRTNLKTIARLHGGNTDAWKGQEITLFPTQVPFKGRMVPAIRIKDDVSGERVLVQRNPEITDADIPF